MHELMDYFRKTGAQGGRSRAAGMTPEERSESARKAVQARWAKARSKNAAKVSTKKATKAKARKAAK